MQHAYLKGTILKRNARGRALVRGMVALTLLGIQGWKMTGAGVCKVERMIDR